MADRGHASRRAGLFAVPPGVDFAAAVVSGLLDRYAGTPPEDLARLTLFVNTRRMERRISAILSESGARLLPRIRLITDLALDPIVADLKPPSVGLRRRLELSTLLARLLDLQPDLAPRSALYDLTDSLAALLDEIAGEGLSNDVFETLQVDDQSGHWERSLAFLRIVQGYLEDGTSGPSLEQRQRVAVERLAAKWQAGPPDDPIIIAGSTGSRGATLAFMLAVAGLPNGAVVLPGLDADLPADVWDRISTDTGLEDHPQYRLAHLAMALGIPAGDIPGWHDASAPAPARNKIISLALRPAPVTDSWLEEGPKLTDLRNAMRDVTLVEAQTRRDEANAIALRLRQAAQAGETAALVTPDRTLTRRVAAALDRWGIVADDSAGTPLGQTPPGRLIRMTADLMTRKITADRLVGLLKHPLVSTGQATRLNRGRHLLLTRELELSFRQDMVGTVAPGHLDRWAAADPDRAAWTTWIAHSILPAEQQGNRTVSAYVETHFALLEALAAGPEASNSKELWDQAPGRESARLFDQMREAAGAGEEVSSDDYAALISRLVSAASVRNPDESTPGILMWGTLEARVQGADLVILGGLNDGEWPASPNPDPWLNRAMRKRCGLLSPERSIGLAAHDFQQAAAAPIIWLTRALRTDDAETIPSRWLNRLTNLLAGLPEQGGQTSLKEMRDRGQVWLAAARALDLPSDEHITRPAARPSPKPPVPARPNRLSVTQIRTLIRDPYSIYARNILRLKPLGQLSPIPSPMLRGIIVHRILEDFVKERPTNPVDADEIARLMVLAGKHLFAVGDWPGIQALWRGRLERVASWLVRTEADRHEIARPSAFETKGEAHVGRLDFVLSGTADRIDLTPDGQAVIYDYKTGTPPSPKAQRYFDKQLLLEAALMVRGGFGEVAARDVIAASYIGLGSSPKEVAADLEESPPEAVWAELETLLAAWMTNAKGYTARSAPQFVQDETDYDHLSRFGEWDETEEPEQSPPWSN